MYIKKAIIYTNQLTKMQKFYCETLNFPLVTNTPTSFEVQIGTSILSIIQSEIIEETQYHFAFNIPSNLFNEAKEWAQTRVNLLKEDDVDEIFFEWHNSHSFYFLDPCENVVELIAQHDVSPISYQKQFSSDLIFNIAEMNITTDNVLLVGEKLKRLGIPVRNNEQLDEKSLNFMGEKGDGTFLLLGPSERTWYFSSKKAVVSPVMLELSNNLVIVLDCEGHLSAEKLEELK